MVSIRKSCVSNMLSLYVDCDDHDDHVASYTCACMRVTDRESTLSEVVSGDLPILRFGCVHPETTGGRYGTAVSRVLSLGTGEGGAAWESGAAFYDDDGIAALCDPVRESYPSGLRVYVTGLPEGLPVGVAEIQYRLGDDPAATGAWEVDGSTLVVPDDLVEAVLNAGRIAVRVHDHTLVHQWANGSVIYLLMSECAGW